MKFIAGFAAVAGLLGVVLGAFAAHGLKDRLSEKLLSTFQTGVQYQMVHALAILLVFVLYRQTPDKFLVWSGGLFSLGILLFSGSLYLLALTQISWFGPVTPLGGVCFILGWIGLFVAIWRSQGMPL